MWGIPDLKNALQAALNSFYDENLKQTLEQKSSEYKRLLKANFVYSQGTQQALIAIALALLLVIIIAYFWKG